MKRFQTGLKQTGFRVSTEGKQSSAYVQLGIFVLAEYITKAQCAATHLKRYSAKAYHAKLKMSTMFVTHLAMRYRAANI